jgi:hypothetical protein
MLGDIFPEQSSAEGQKNEFEGQGNKEAAKTQGGCCLLGCVSVDDPTSRTARRTSIRTLRTSYNTVI